MIAIVLSVLFLVASGQSSVDALRCTLHSEITIGVEELKAQTFVAGDDAEYSVYKEKSDKHAEIEDRLVVHQDSCGNKYYGIFDGHGGANTSNFLKKEAPELISKAISSVLEKELTGSNQVEAIKKSVSDAVAELDRRVQELFEDGSTLNMIVDTRAYMIAINVGDSRSIAIDPDHQVFALTDDHKPSSPLERERILASGTSYVGSLWKKYHEISRVRLIKSRSRGGGLAMSRSIGDKKWRNRGLALISTPDVFVYEKLDEVAIPVAIVLASDGIWDRLSNEDVAQILIDGVCKHNESLDEVLVHIAKLARERTSKDDISIVLSTRVEDLCNGTENNKLPPSPKIPTGI